MLITRKRLLEKADKLHRLLLRKGLVAPDGSGDPVAEEGKSILKLLAAEKLEVDEWSILTWRRFKRLNKDNEFYGHSLEEVWSRVQKILKDDEMFQIVIDYIVSDLGDVITVRE